MRAARRKAIFPAPPAPASTGHVAVNAVVDSFSAFVLSRGADAERLIPSIPEGLRLLRSAVASLELQGPAAALAVPAPDTLAAFGVPGAVGNARALPDQFRELADAVMKLQRDRFAHLERAAAQFRSAADVIQNDVPLELQAVAVERYFDRASDVLRGMAEMKP
jgi:hypothetical protein